MGNLTLNGKTYAASGHTSDGKTLWVERSSGVVSGFSPLTARVRTGTGQQKTRVNWVLKVPTVASAASACSCEGDVLTERYFNIEYVADAKTTAAERTDDQLRLAGLIATADFVNSVKDLIQP